jgi:hypothetical protein
MWVDAVDWHALRRFASAVLGDFAGEQHAVRTLLIIGLASFNDAFFFNFPKVQKRQYLF